MTAVAGMTGSQMITEVCGSLLTDTKTAVQTEVLRWLNNAQLDLYAIAEWPELIVANASFTVTGASTYDLTSKVSASFGKVIDRTIRYETYNLVPKPKSFFDEVDPEGTQTGKPEFYCQYNRLDFRLWPNPGSGTVYLDYVKYPDAITISTTAAQVSFDPDRHELIVNCALWRLYRKYLGMSTLEIEEYKRSWRDDAKTLLGLSSPVRTTPKFIIGSF